MPAEILGGGDDELRPILDQLTEGLTLAQGEFVIVEEIEAVCWSPKDSAEWVRWE